MYDECIRYALEVLLGDHCDVASLRDMIAYAEPSSVAGLASRLCIVPSGMFNSTYGTLESLPSEPVQEYMGTPIIYGTPCVTADGSRLIVWADIIASTYFMVTRYEEWVKPAERDQFGRFPGRSSLAYRAGFLMRPIVHEYSCLLRSWLRDLGMEIPGSSNRFSVVFTHDLDVPRRYRRWRDVASLLRAWANGHSTARQVLGATGAVLGLCRDPYDTCYLMRRHEAMLAIDTPVSAIHFVLASVVIDDDHRYSLDEACVVELLREARRYGESVGLHLTYGAACSPQRASEEMEHLRLLCPDVVTKSRFHYLRWIEPEALIVLEEAKITDDYTLGYADLVGFRLGVCRPIRLFCPLRRVATMITGHSLTLMDCTLREYMKLDVASAIECCRSIVNQTTKYNGELVALWHNTSFAGDMREYHHAVYAGLVGCIAAHGAHSA